MDSSLPCISLPLSYIPGRIVLSHVYVSTLRRTRSTQKFISTGLASGGLAACCWWRSLRGRGVGLSCDATNFPPAAACILGASVQRKRRQAWCWCSGRKSSERVCGQKPIVESSGRRKVRRMAMFALQESVFGSEIYFREQHACYGQVSSIGAVRLGVGARVGSLPRAFVASDLFSRAVAGRKFVAWPCLRFKKEFLGLKSIFESMTGRIVLSHVYLSTLRRTRSTQKFISTGLASGGLEACCWWRSLRERGFGLS